MADYVSIDMFNKLITAMTAISRKVKTLEEALASKKRVRTTYSNYEKIKKMSDTGLEPKDISDRLGIPYTTVRKYLSWTEEDAQRKWDEEFGG